MPTESMLRKNVQIVSLSIPIGLDTLLTTQAKEKGFRSKSQYVSHLLLKHTGYSTKDFKPIIPTEARKISPVHKLNKADVSTAMKTIFPLKKPKKDMLKRIDMIRRKREQQGK